MATERPPVSPGEPRLYLAGTDDEVGIRAAIELGNHAPDTLGHLPFAVYEQAAADGTLLLAETRGAIVGYALYGLTTRWIRLTHLCVDHEWRRHGIASLLVDTISRRHAGYPGILAKCRDDYGLGPLWIRLGFVQVNVRPGRSRAGHPMTSWWRDHGHPNLFSRDEDTVLVRAAIDLNILRDLAETGRTDAGEAQSLVDDQVSDRLELVRTAALDAEIDSMRGPTRSRCITRLRDVTSVRPEQARVRHVAAKLLEAVHVVEPPYPRSPQDERDLAYVAEAVAAGLNVFITRDQSLTSTLGPAANRMSGIRILRPADVVVHLDELSRAEAYRPAALLGTSYRRKLIGPGADNELASLANEVAGERPRHLVKAARDLALAGHERSGIYQPGGRLIAVVVTRITGKTLSVPLLRVANVGLADTLARQLLFQLRWQARETGASVIRILDRYLPLSVRLAALEDGFRQSAELYEAFVVDRCGSGDEVERHAVVAAREAGIPEPAPLRSSMPAVVAAELERRWWPAKISDSQLPTYLIPIQQAFSADLLGVPEGLLPRDESLGMAREHVYYRSPRGLGMQAPARLLWYMSGGGRSVAYPSAVIACSQLDAVVTGDPEDLFDQFRHLGVWDQSQVFRVARDGIVQALRFTNTELLAHLQLSRLRAIADAHDQRGIPPQGPIQVSPAMFTSIYREGRSQ